MTSKRKYDIIYNLRRGKWIEEVLDLEDREIITDRDCLREWLMYFKWFAKNNKLNFEETGNLVDTFFTNYPNLYQKSSKEISLFLKQKNFKEKSALHEILYRFLEDENTTELKKCHLLMT